MSIYEQCSPSVVVDSDQLRAIGEMYPYDTLGYRDVGAMTRAFLENQCADFPPDTLVVTISQHNGRGYQWGVVLLQYPFWKAEWHLFGQFGHERWAICRGVSRRHFSLIKRHTIPTETPDNGKRIVRARQLGDIFVQQKAA